MNLLTDFTDDDYERIWTAPNGSDYGVQKKSATELYWSTYLFAVPKEAAREWLNQAGQFATSQCIYRLVRFSRYPPCSVIEICKVLTGE